MQTIEERQAEVVEEFADLDDWMDRYQLLIDLGEELAALPEQDRVPGNLIDGCQSRVWLAWESDTEGRLTFRADSDALIVKGIISLLITVVSGQKARDIAGADLHFLADIGLAEHLSPTRANGLAAMVARIREIATNS